MFAVLMVCNVGASPLIAMRLRANDTETSEIWKSNFSEIARHPGCCDEIWFSTGCGAPSLDWHRARAAVIADAMADAKAAGITPSLQFQATLGHGDRFGTPEMFSMKTWTGWTGWSGIETKYCNCPRQPAFHAYLREVAKIYAPLGFAGLWIDDDLRIANHQPSDSYGRHIGCWCKMCLTAFNSENGATWTREKLAKAVETDDALFARWRKFSVDGLCIVARTIAETFHELSPDTMMALQHASGEDSADQVVAVLKELHEISGHFVGFRPGGGNYYDDDPNGVICKSIGSGWFRNRIGDPCYVKVWTPEIESWPRTYYSRSPQGVLVEGFAALMSGMNSVSFFISNSAMEDPALYGRTYWKSLAEASPVLHGYAKTIDGCTAVGFIMPGDPQIGIRRTAIPVLAGPGRSFGELTTADCERNVNRMTSSEVQGFRDELDRRAGGLPALVQSPFIGLMQVHVDGGGNFRCLALLNLRISEQGPVQILLRKVPSEWTHVVWNEMRRSPVRLQLERSGDDSFVTIPLVGAWNGGYLSGVSDCPNQTGAEQIASERKGSVKVFETALSETEARIWKSPSGGTLPYRLHIPARFEPGRRYPLVIHMHGAGSWGTNNVDQIRTGGADFISWTKKRGEEYMFIAPQTPKGRKWVDTPWGHEKSSMKETPSPSLRMAMEIVDDALARYPVDRDRIYLMGISMGGYAAWELLQRRPELFAAALPCCGGGDVALAPQLKDVAIWAFHGSEDKTVPVSRSRDMVSAIREAGGGKVTYKEFDGLGHNVWTLAFGDDKVFDWLFSQHRCVGPK